LISVNFLIKFTVMNTLFPINKIYPLKISCPASKSAAPVLDHHVLGYTYDSESPQLAFQVSQPKLDTDTSKHIVPKFSLIKEIDTLTGKKKNRRK
jgi:hypothetical protein